MNTFKIQLALIILLIVSFSKTHGQNVPKLLTDGQVCMVYTVLKEKQKEINKFFLKPENDSIQDCFNATNDTLLRKIYYPMDSEIFLERHFGSSLEAKDSVLKIHNLIEQFLDTVQLTEPAYANCSCSFRKSCFDVRYSPVFRNVFSVEVRLRKYDSWNYSVSEEKMVFTFLTAKDGDVIGCKRLK